MPHACCCNQVVTTKNAEPEYYSGNFLETYFGIITFLIDLLQNTSPVVLIQYL